MSVTTSDRASYREEHVIAFLEAHLPIMEEGRRWRVMVADAMAAHLSENVQRLCWSRGYVMICHGGGATPVAQTPDTALNQHIRRNHTEKEVPLLIEQARRGVKVPKLSHEQIIDCMSEVLADTALHLEAAKAYKKTGATNDLEGKEDHLIVREAAQFWNDPDDPMPRLRSTVLDDVRVEWEAGRLLSLIHN